MNIDEVDDRKVLEIRELLRQTRNRDAVARFLHNRGLEEADARELVYAIHKANLTANRKGALYKMIGGGAVLALGLLIVFGAHRIGAGLVIMLVLSGGGFLWGLTGFIMANGYEVDPD